MSSPRSLAGRSAGGFGEPGSEKLRVLFVGSSGGHLAQMWPLAQALPDTNRHWVTFPLADAKSLLAEESVTWCHHPTARNLPNLLRNWRQATKVLRVFRPHVIVSTGSGPAVPYFLQARRFGSRTMYVEVIDRIASRTLTSRIVYPFTNDFLVQWPQQQNLYPDAHVIGPVIE